MNIPRKGGPPATITVEKHGDSHNPEHYATFFTNAGTVATVQAALDALEPRIPLDACVTCEIPTPLSES